MIVAALLGLLYFMSGGMSGGPGQFGELMSRFAKDQVKVAVQDEGRREKALHALKELNGDVDDLNEQVAKDVKQFEKLVKDYQSTPEDFDRQVESAAAKHRDLVDRIWESRVALLKEIRADEWKAILDGAKAEAAKKAHKEK